MVISLVKYKSGLKTSLAVSSIEFCQCKFDEGDIREGLSGGCGHIFMIPLSSPNQSKIVAIDLAEALSYHPKLMLG